MRREKTIFRCMSKDLFLKSSGRDSRREPDAPAKVKTLVVSVERLVIGEMRLIPINRQFFTEYPREGRACSTGARIICGGGHISTSGFG